MSYQQQTQVYYYEQNQTPVVEPPPFVVNHLPQKNEKTALILAVISLFLGGIGLHRFYLGFYLTGLNHLAFCFTSYLLFGWFYLYVPLFIAILVWNLVDIILYKHLTFRSNNGLFRF